MLVPSQGISVYNNEIRIGHYYNLMDSPNSGGMIYDLSEVTFTYDEFEVIDTVAEV
jgi:hypothetical protein